jgi:hypothetical protein
MKWKLENDFMFKKLMKEHIADLHRFCKKYELTSLFYPPTTGKKYFAKLIYQAGRYNYYFAKD